MKETWKVAKTLSSQIPKLMELLNEIWRGDNAIMLHSLCKIICRAYLRWCCHQDFYNEHFMFMRYFEELTINWCCTTRREGKSLIIKTQNCLLCGWCLYAGMHVSTFNIACKINWISHYVRQQIFRNYQVNQKFNNNIFLCTTTGLDKYICTKARTSTFLPNTVLPSNLP